MGLFANNFRSFMSFSWASFLFLTALNLLGKRMFRNVSTQEINFWFSIIFRVTENSPFSQLQTLKIVHLKKKPNKFFHTIWYTAAIANDFTLCSYNIVFATTSLTRAHFAKQKKLYRKKQRGIKEKKKIKKVKKEACIGASYNVAARKKERDSCGDGSRCWSRAAAHKFP